MFNYENTITGKMNIEELWDLYSNVNRWHEWDTEMQKIELEGEFTTGTKGTMFMNGMPPLPFILDEVEKNKKFIDTSTLGNITVQFGHFIINEGNDVYTLKHTVTLTGASDEELEGIGKGIVSDLPESMEKLYQLSRTDK